MAKDYTKYNVESVGSNLNKARLVQKIVTHHAGSFDGNYQAFLEIWFDDLQGGKGVCKALTEIDAKNERNYYIKEPITLSDGTEIAVCNQWGKENLSNFLLHAGTLGYVITTEGDNNTTSEPEEIPTENTSEDDIVEGSSDWKLPHALAFVIRHMMITDGEVHEGELNVMQVAFNEYDEQEIEVRDVWDDVDTQAQFYWKLGKHNTLLVNCINYLAANLDNAQKSRLIQLLMEMSAQDNLVSKDEYVTLLLIAKNFYAGGAPYPIKDVFDNAGIAIEE